MEKLIEYSKKANDLYMSADFQEALKYYFLALTEDTKNSTVHCNIAMAYEMLSELELAVAFYKKSIRLDEKNIRAVNNLARIYIDNIKDYDIAIRYLDYAIKTEPNDAEAYNLYGNLYLLKEDFKMAENYLKKSIFLDENYFKNYYDLAKAFIGLKEPDKAREALDKSIELRSDFIPAIKLKESLK